MAQPLLMRTIYFYLSPLLVTQVEYDTLILRTGYFPNPTVGPGADNSTKLTALYVNLDGAMDGFIVAWDDTEQKLVLQANEGGPAYVTLLGAALANGVIFTSEAYDRDVPFPGRSFVSVRLQITADATYTAKLQTSPEGGVWTDSVTYTVVTSNGSSTVDATITPSVRFVRWVITATAAGMTSMNAKAVLS